MMLPPFGDKDVFYALSNNNQDLKGFDCYATLAHDYRIVDELERLQLDPETFTREERAFTSMAWCGIVGWYQQGATAVIGRASIK